MLLFLILPSQNNGYYNHLYFVDKSVPDLKIAFFVLCESSTSWTVPTHMGWGVIFLNNYLLILMNSFVLMYSNVSFLQSQTYQETTHCPWVSQLSVVIIDT